MWKDRATSSLVDTKGMPFTLPFAVIDEWSCGKAVVKIAMSKDLEHHHSLPLV
jgi:hypothetical protein